MKSTLLALLAAACGLLAGCSSKSAEDWTGYAQADLVYVAAPVSGQLKTLAVARGAQVAAGAPLFQVDADASAFAAAEAAARLAQSNAQAANLRSGKRPPEIRVIEDQLRQAQAAARASAAQYRRYEDLAKNNFVSPNLLENLRAQSEADAARAAELQSQLVVAREAARPQEIAAAEAGSAAAQAALAQNRWREQQTAQAAPVAAVVYDTLYRVGEQVPANAPVVVLLPEGAVKLRFFVPEPALGRLAVGQTVAASCDGCPAGLTATVDFISPQAEFTPPVIFSNDSRAKLVFMVEARPPAAARAAFKPGQPVQVRPAP
jgi:HlyD family secretion protein